MASWGGIVHKREDCPEPPPKPISRSQRYFSPRIGLAHNGTISRPVLMSQELIPTPSIARRFEVESIT